MNFQADQFGKAMLREDLEKEGQTKPLELLPKLQISINDAIIDSVGWHLLMSPLIDDLKCTLFINETKEDFLTSDHPIALCNNLPLGSSSEANTGFASRGLIIAFPLSPHALLLLNDREVYLIEGEEHNAVTVRDKRDVVELNILQCMNALDNLYFSSSSKIQETLKTFRNRRDTLRRPRPEIKRKQLINPSGRKLVLFNLPHLKRRLMLSRILKIKHVTKSGRYILGNSMIRDPVQTLFVKEALSRFQKDREQAQKQG